MATGTDDPIRDLNNYLQEVRKGENLTQYLTFTSQQTGRNSEAVHTGTYTLRNVTIGEGKDITKNGAKRHAATQGLEFLRKNGIPEKKPE